MKKYIKFSYVLTVGAIAFLSSCVDLNTELLGSRFSESQKQELFKKEPNKATTEINALYAALGEINITTEWLGGGNHSDFGFPATAMFYDHAGMDMVSPNVGYNWFRSALNLTSNANPQSTTTYFIWKQNYANIRNANQIIKQFSPEYLKSLETTGNLGKLETVKSYRGQALTFRAYHYLNLVQSYQFTYKGNEDKPAVPLITETSKGALPRATVAQVYEQITKDLTEAIDILPTERASKAVINKNVALALAARTAMLMHQFDKAIDFAKQARQGYHVFSKEQVSQPGFSDINESAWIWGVDLNKESRSAKGIVNFTSQMCSFGGNGYAPSYAGRFISSDLFNQISETDVRKGWWLRPGKYELHFFEGLDKPIVWDVTDPSIINPELPTDKKELSVATLNGVYSPNVDYGWSTLSDKNVPLRIDQVLGWSTYLNVKFAPPGNEYLSATNDTDFPLIRAEEMVLIEAEALAHLGKNAEAAAVLKELMAQRDPAWNETSVTVDDIYLQRRIELWGEGFALFDILRLNKPLSRTAQNFDDAFRCYIPANSPILIYCIPEDEITNNPRISEEQNNSSDQIAKYKN